MKAVCGPGRGGAPETRTAPRSGRISPLIMRRRVVFPQPEGPSRLTKRFSGMDSETSASAWTDSPEAPRKDFQTCDTSTLGDAPAPESCADVPSAVSVGGLPSGLIKPRIGAAGRKG